jgi:DNA-binding XRE family transcriptional regulator
MSEPTKRKEKFAARIKAARKKLGLSQRQAALLWGFSRPTLNQWESETYTPRGLYREKLEAILTEVEALTIG